MKTLKAQITRDSNLFLAGDFHAGAAHLHESGLDQLIEDVKGEYEGLPAANNFLVLHGDLIEAISIDDPRFCLESAAETDILNQIDYIVSKLYPVKDKIVCSLQGNHELKRHRFGDISKKICQRLQCPYGTYTALISYYDEDGKFMWNHFATHGSRQISSSADDPVRRDANLLLTLKRHLKRKVSAYLMSKAHTHKLLVCKPNSELYLDLAGGKIVKKQTHDTTQHPTGYLHWDYRWYVNTGSFLRLYVDGISGYAERGEYDPQELGYAVALIRDGEIKDIKKVEV